MENFKIDVVNKTMTITKAFDDKLSDTSSAEFKKYREFIELIPDLRVIRKTHKTPIKYHSPIDNRDYSCNQYKNLTYENMEIFISSIPDNEKYFEEYSAIRYSDKCVPSVYAEVRRWFVKTFPDYRTNPLSYFKKFENTLSNDTPKAA